MVKEIDATITVDSTKVVEPYYYDEERFHGWRHSMNGWSPAESEDHQRQPSGSTEKNQYHLEVNKHPYKAAVHDGPETQEVRLWKDESIWGDADERQRINAPYAPYAVFMAVLREPENFL